MEGEILMGYQHEIKSFLVENRPFGYVSKQKKQLMDEILLLDQRYRKYTYQYLNEDYYREIILMICFDYVLQSLRNDKQFSAKDLKINDSLEYDGKYYFFEGCTDSGMCTLKPDTRSKNPCTLSLPIERLEKYAHKTKTVKKRRASGYLNKFAKYFDLDLKGLTNNEQIAVLLPKNIYEEIIRSFFFVNGEKLFFSQICSSSYLTSGGNIQASLHSDSAVTPFVLFSSSASELVNYIDGEEAQLKGIYVFGDKWFTEHNLPETLSLPYLAEMNNLPIAFFSSNRMISNNDSLKLINDTGSNQNWLFEYGEKLALKAAHTNENLKNTLSHLMDTLKEIDEDPKLRYLSKLTWTALRTSLSLASMNSSVLKYQINQVEEYIKIRKIVDEQDIINDLHSLLINRFGAQVKKTILKTISDSFQYALIVPDDLKEEYELLFKQENVAIFSFRDRVAEDMYGKFDTIILVNPYAQERKKWAQAFLALNVVFVIPEVFLRVFQRSIRNEERLILSLMSSKKLTANVSLEHPYEGALKLLLSDIKTYLSRKQKPTNSSAVIDGSEIMEKVETNEDEVLSSDEIYEAKIKLRAETLSDKPTDNAQVEVHKVFQLTDGYELYGTDKARIFTVTRDGILARRSINDISKNDKIVDFIIPYSDSYYRDWFKRLSEKEISLKSKDEINDFRWKRAFINFINRHGYSPSMLKRRMEMLGAPLHTTAYYAAWSDVNKMPILPREPLFIQYVGKLIGNGDIDDNYLSFYQSSEAIKKKFSESRENELVELNHKKLSSVNQNYLISEIVSTKKVDIPDVPRFMTNTLLRG